MHNLFNLMPNIEHGILRLPEWAYVRTELRRNLDRVIAYYRKHPTAVHSAHFLVRLLQSITVPKSLNLERYYYNVDAGALNLSMALKMTSSIYRGQLFDGVFYSDCKEILIAHSEPFDFHQAHRNWETLCPIEVLRHPLSDLGLGLPDGDKIGSDYGIAVISINIPMLAVQYRAFRINEEYLTGNSDSQRSVMQFIRMYVIPNMLPSHLDHCLFNRIYNLHIGAPSVLHYGFV
jgi:hypothetical protein